MKLLLMPLFQSQDENAVNSPFGSRRESDEITWKSFKVLIFEVQFLHHFLGGPLTIYSSMSALQLISACAGSNDGEVWDEFIFRFHKPISISVFRIVSRSGVSGSRLVDDLVQDTYLKLCGDQCGHLLDFARQHPEAVVGYVKTVAANVAYDHLKAIRSFKRGSGNLVQPLEEMEPRGSIHGVGSELAVERRTLLREINDCLTACAKGQDPDRDRMVFWLYYQQGMTAKSIAALPTICLTVKGVESVINRLTRLVREHLVSDLESSACKQKLSGKKGFHPAESF